MTVTIRLTAGAADIVDLDARVRQAISEEAALRQVSSRGLVALILEAVARQDLFADVLDRGGRT